MFQYVHLAGGTQIPTTSGDPLALRKAPLASVAAEASARIRLNERIEGFRRISGIGQKLGSNRKAGSQLIF